MSTLLELLSRNKQGLLNQYAELDRLEARLYPLQEMLETVKVLHPAATLMVLGPLVVLDLPVGSFKEVEGLLSLIEDRLQITFDVSEDKPDGGWREYSSKALPGFRVDANVLREGSSNCRRVPIGVETITKYKFVCDDEGEEK